MLVICLVSQFAIVLSVSLPTIYLSGINLLIHYICVCITVPAPTVVVTNTTVIRGSDAVLTCTVTAVDDNADDLSSNIVWSPTRGTAEDTVQNNIFTSTYTISNVVFDDAGIYTCTANISHTSEYVLTSDSESGEGSVSITS